MELDTGDIDPELERRSRRNKIAVTIGFLVLIVATLLLARLMVSIVKPPQSTTPAIESPAPVENQP